MVFCDRRPILDIRPRISKNIKSYVLQLWDHGWECRYYRWRRIVDEFGTVKKPPSPFVGRTRIITRALMTATKDLFAEDSDLFLDEVCTWLTFQHNITISPSTSSCNLTQSGHTRKVLQRIASKRYEARREDFKSLRNDLVGDGSEFALVLDETSKNERTYDQFPFGHTGAM